MIQLILLSSCGTESNLWMTGSRKAAVLPVPVWAEAITSLPARMEGITCCWTGVALIYPIESIPSINRSCRPNSENVKLCYFKLMILLHRLVSMQAIIYVGNKTNDDLMDANINNICFEIF